MIGKERTTYCQDVSRRKEERKTQVGQGLSRWVESRIGEDKGQELKRIKVKELKRIKIYSLQGKLRLRRLQRRDTQISKKRQPCYSSDLPI